MVVASSTVERKLSRAPQQERAERRLQGFLDAAAELVVEVGFEALTMAGIAKRANSSVGALYDYFPDKVTIARTLLDRYAKEIETHWKPVIEGAPTANCGEFVGHFVEQISRFLKKRPAYLHLLSGSFYYQRDPAARKAIRMSFAGVFCVKNPNLDKKRALLAANVIIELIHAMSALQARASPSEKGIITADFKRIITSYLEELLSS